MLAAILALLGAGLVPAAANAATVYTGSVPTGTILYAGDSLYSPSGRYRLVVQTDGNSVVYSNFNEALWSTGQYGGADSTLRPQADGNLVKYSGTNQPLWQSGSSGPATRLVMQDDGNLVMYTATNQSVWAAFSHLDHIYPGQTLYGGESLHDGRAYELRMQTDGNLVLYGNGTARWQTQTNGNPGARLILQTDGNLVVYSPSNVVLWQTNTVGTSAERFVVQADGNLVLYKQGGGYTWNRLGFGTSSGAKVPATGRVTGVYAPKHCDGSGTSQHYGIDIAAPTNTPVVASSAGTVQVRDTGSTGYGKNIVITHANGWSTLYGHLNAFSVSNGATVTQGQQIGLMGNTGASRGSHVHFELRLSGVAQSSMNGYFACGNYVTQGATITGSFPGL